MITYHHAILPSPLPTLAPPTFSLYVSSVKTILSRVHLNCDFVPTDCVWACILRLVSWLYVCVPLLSFNGIQAHLRPKPPNILQVSGSIKKVCPDLQDCLALFGILLNRELANPGGQPPPPFFLCVFSCDNTLVSAIDRSVFSNEHSRICEASVKIREPCSPGRPSPPTLSLEIVCVLIDHRNTTLYICDYH